MPLEKITPRGDGEGSIGSASKTWGKGYFDNLHCAESFKYPLTTFAQRPAFDLEPGQTLFDLDANALIVWDGEDWIILSGSNLVAINVLAGTGGTAEGRGTYNKGSPAIIKAIPDDGYEFDSWIGDSLDIDNTNLYQTFITPEESATVTATFKPRSYEINLSTNNPEYGTVLLDRLAPYNHGEIVTITAKPTNPNFYEFVGWSGLGADLIDTTQAEVTFSLTQEISLIAEFRILSYTIDISTTFNNAPGNFAGITMYEYGNEFNIFNLSSTGNGTYTVTLPSTTKFTIALVPNNPSIEVRGASSESDDPHLEFAPQSGDSPYDFVHYNHDLGSDLDIDIAINVLSFDTTLVPTDLDMEYLFSEDNEGAKPETENETNPILHLSTVFPGGVNASTDLTALTHLSFLFEFLSGIDLNGVPIPDDNMPTISPETTPTASNGLQGITFSNIQYNATYTVKVKNTIDVVALNLTDINDITLTDTSLIGSTINVQGNDYTIVENDLVYDSTNTEFYYFKKGESNQATLERYNGPVYDFEEVTNGEFVDGAFRERLLNTGNELLYNDSNKTFTFKGLDQPQSLLLRWKTYPFAKITTSNSAYFGDQIEILNGSFVSRRVALESVPTGRHSTIGSFSNESISATVDGTSQTPNISPRKYVRLQSDSYIEIYNAPQNLGKISSSSGFVVCMRLGSLPNSNDCALFSRDEFRVTLSNSSDLQDNQKISLDGKGYVNNTDFDFGVSGEVSAETFIISKFDGNKHYGAALLSSGEVSFNSDGITVPNYTPSTSEFFRIGSNNLGFDGLVKDIIIITDSNFIKELSIEDLATEYHRFFKGEISFNQISWSGVVQDFFSFDSDDYPNFTGSKGNLQAALINGSPSDLQNGYIIDVPGDSSSNSPEIEISLTVTNEDGLQNTTSTSVPILPAPMEPIETLNFITRIVNEPGGEELLKAPIIISSSVQTTLNNGYTITE
jgi:hypothetical protein